MYGYRLTDGYVQFNHFNNYELPVVMKHVA